MFAESSIFLKKSARPDEFLGQFKIVCGLKELVLISLAPKYPISLTLFSSNTYKETSPFKTKRSALFCKVKVSEFLMVLESKNSTIAIPDVQPAIWVIVSAPETLK